jgi:hypothetical protein
MQRLDSAFWTLWNKWLFYIFLALLWCLTLHGFVTGNQRVTIFYYLLPPCTIGILWWLSGFKQVTLDGDSLIIRDYRREARVPMSLVMRIGENRRRGMDYITIVFKARTEFGRRVRIMPGLTSDNDFDQITKILRGAMKWKNIGVSINQVKSESALVSNSKNGKEVIVRGWAGEELSKILADFADVYSDSLGHNFDFEVSPLDQGSTRITFPHDISARQFSFLINYLQYPKDCDLKGRSISVVGRALLSPDFHPPNKKLTGQSAVFYIPSKDQDYDLVYVRAGNETFANSFSAIRWKKVTDSRIPAGVEIG